MSQSTGYLLRGCCPLEHCRKLQRRVLTFCGAENIQQLLVCVIDWVMFLAVGESLLLTLSGVEVRCCPDLAVLRATPDS
jgi:hypothetical protein